MFTTLSQLWPYGWASRLSGAIPLPWQPSRTPLNPPTRQTSPSPTCSGTPAVKISGSIAWIRLEFELAGAEGNGTTRMVACGDWNQFIESGIPLLFTWFVRSSSGAPVLPKVSSKFEECERPGHDSLGMFAGWLIAIVSMPVSYLMFGEGCVTVLIFGLGVAIGFGVFIWLSMATPPDMNLKRKFAVDKEN